VAVKGDEGVPANHAKFISADGEVAIIGSGNMDQMSWKHSRELNILIDDAASAGKLDAIVFEPYWKNGIDA
jgi:phosphatidylserine/phosphatidylglycerophosphate/cardiolipin synthase-like enzyme